MTACLLTRGRRAAGLVPAVYTAGTSPAARFASACAVLVGLGQAAPAQPTDADRYEAQVRPFLVRHCLECHGTQKPKGDLRLDQLAPEFARKADQDRWQAVLKRVTAGEMPPKAKPRPTEQEIRAVSEWIRAGVQAAEALRRTQGRVVLRRLNRIEYENTVRDLLGVHVQLKDRCHALSFL